METTRRDLLRLGASAGGGLAVSLAASPVLPAIQEAFAKAGGDQAILAAAIRLEQATALVYEKASVRPGFPAGLRGAAALFAGQEREHAAVLVTALERLGGVPPVKPTSAPQVPGLPAALAAGARATMRLALRLEQQAIGTYHAAVRRFSDSKLQETAATIMATDGEQMVVLRQGLGLPTVPDAFPIGGPVRPGS